MSIASEKLTRDQVFTVPNQLTAVRLLLSIVLFVLIPLQYYLASTLVFVVAAGTDWLDGYSAHKYGQVTKLGRILDPFVDKLIICGTFIYLGAIPGSHIAAWMAVVIVGRELLVTALRSFLESEGADFSAAMSGKLKMVFQCAAATLSLFNLMYLAHLDGGTADAPVETARWLTIALPLAIWPAVVLTLYSGVEYIWRAVSLLRR